MKKESNRLKAKKKLTFYTRWDFWERQAKKAFFWPVTHWTEIQNFGQKLSLIFSVL